MRSVVTSRRRSSVGSYAMLHMYDPVKRTRDGATSPFDASGYVVTVPVDSFPEKISPCTKSAAISTGDNWPLLPNERSGKGRCATGRSAANTNTWFVPFVETQ